MLHNVLYVCMFTGKGRRSGGGWWRRNITLRRKQTEEQMTHSSYYHVVRCRGHVAICSYHVRVGIHGKVVGVVVKETEQPLLNGGFGGGGAEVSGQPRTMLSK